MMKQLVFCSNCGYELGRSARGTRTELQCPRCRMRMEYTVEEDTVSVRMIRMYGNQHAINQQKTLDKKSKKS